MHSKNILQNILYFLAALVIFIFARLIYLTCKKEVIRSPEIEAYEASRKPVIYALWHGRMFPMGFVQPKYNKLHTIISRHGDGQIISFVMMLLGVGTVRGSTNRGSGEHKKGFPSKDRGGTYVIRRAITLLQQGDSIVITPDGPKGPRFAFKTNSIKIASESNAAIIPISYSASSAKIFNSWDRFILPLPFSRIKIKFGKLNFIPKDISDEEIEKYGKAIEDELNNLTIELDKEFNINLN
jgi:lysophospholipid acyltransferase (LPLAT)-like uncharacterized protein